MSPRKSCGQAGQAAPPRCTAANLRVGGLQHTARAAKQPQEHQLRLLQARVGGNRLQQVRLDLLRTGQRGVGQGRGSLREGLNLAVALRGLGGNVAQGCMRGLLGNAEQKNLLSWCRAALLVLCARGERVQTSKVVPQRGSRSSGGPAAGGGWRVLTCASSGRWPSTNSSSRQSYSLTAPRPSAKAATCGAREGAGRQGAACLQGRAGGQGCQKRPGPVQRSPLQSSPGFVAAPALRRCPQARPPAASSPPS